MRSAHILSALSVPACTRASGSTYVASPSSAHSSSLVRSGKPRCVISCVSTQSVRERLLGGVAADGDADGG